MSSQRDNLALVGVVGVDFTALEVKEYLNTLDDNTQDITVFLSSPGGFADEGFAIRDLFNQHAGKVTVKVGLEASSIASVIALAADELVMSPTAKIIIHSCNINVSNLAAENTVLTAIGMKEYADLMANMNKRIISAYKEAVQAKNVPNPEVVVKLLTENVNDGCDHPYTADELLDLGLCDTIQSSKGIYQNVVLTKDVSATPELVQLAHANAVALYNRAEMRAICALYKDLKEATKYEAIQQLKLSNVVENMKKEDQKEKEKEREKEQAVDNTDDEKEDKKATKNSSKDTEEKETSTDDEDDEELKDQEDVEEEDEEDEEDEKKDKTQAALRVRKALIAERKRVADLTALFAKYKGSIGDKKLTALREKCIANDITLDQAKVKILDLLDNNEKTKIEKSEISLANKGYKSMVKPVELLQAFLTKEFVNRSGLRAQVLEASRCIPSFDKDVETRITEARRDNKSLEAVVTNLLENAGYDISRGNGLAALSTSDFEQVTQYMLNLMVAAGRTYVLDNVFRVVSPRSVASFDETKIYWNDTPVGVFPQVAEGADTPMMSGKLKDATVKLLHYKQGVNFTFESLNKGTVNLYLQQLENLANNATNTFREVILRTIIEQAHKGGKKIDASADYAGILAVDEAYANFKDVNGTPYNVKPKYLLAPAHLRVTVDSLLFNQYKPSREGEERSGFHDYNPFFNYVEPIYDGGLPALTKALNGGENELFFIPEGLVELYTFGNGVTVNAEVEVDAEKNRKVRTRLDFVVFIPRPEEIVYLKAN
ncbi:Clp protease ClpP [Psittacicella hinzii]|nr:Clp protease ClpP [Psittacicella hinzii]